MATLADTCGWGHVAPLQGPCGRGHGRTGTRFLARTWARGHARAVLVLSFVNLKGGVGKTTLAYNVAACLHAAGRRVLLVDADAQASASAVAARAAERGVDAPPVAALSAATLMRDVPRLGEGRDVVVIDGPARLGSESRAAMLASDLVVVPLAPGALDLWAASETVRVLMDARTMRPELDAVAVLNKSDRTTLARFALKAAGELGLPLLGTAVRSRVVFGESLLAGQGVATFAPKSDAALEIRTFTRALLDVVAKKEAAA